GLSHCGSSPASRPESRSVRSRPSASMARAGSFRPRHCHSTVRSLYSSPKQTPWSQPYSRPPLTGSRWPILRSALFTTASNTAMSRRIWLSGLRARVTRSTDLSASIHSWHMPGPNGPSRYTVGGTRSQPAAWDTAYAATSRPASVPCGKSHSGRSPAMGLYTQAAETVPRWIVQYSVALEATTSRPSTSSSPSLSSVRAAASSPGGWPCAGWPWAGWPWADWPGAGWPRERDSRRAGGLSAIGGPVAVLPWADMPLGVQRQPAQRARRPALADDAQRALGERARRCGGDAHPQHPWPVFRDL